LELLELPGTTSELLEGRLSELGITETVLELTPSLGPDEFVEQLAITQSIEIKTRYIKPFLDF
jgi:hypothetical protein